MNNQLDQDTQLRVQRAVSSGMSQDKALKLGMAYQSQKDQAVRMADAQAPKVKTTTEKIAGALPIIGGIAGSFVPGVGTVIGGALGAAGGKLLGNVAINHDTSATNDRSALQGVGTEAALGLVGGVAAKGISALAEPVIGKIAGYGAKAATGGVQTAAQDVAQTAIADGSNYTLSNAAKKKLIASVNKQMAPGMSLTKADEEALIRRTENAYVQGKYGKLPDTTPTQTLTTPQEPVVTTNTPGVINNTTEAPQDLISRLTRGQGQGIRRSVALPKVGVDPYMIRESDKLIANGASSRLKPGSNAYQLKQMPALMDEFSAEASAAFAQSNKRVSTNSVISTLNKVVEENPALLHDKNAVQEAKTLIAQHARANSTNGTMGGQQISDLKRVMGGSQRIWDKINKGTPMAPGEEAFHSAWESLDKVITDMVPEAKNATLKMSGLYKLAPGLAKGMNRNMKVPMLDIQIPGTASLVQGAADRVGNAMIKTADATPGFLQNATGQGLVRSFGIGQQPDGTQNTTDQNTTDQNTSSSLNDATAQLEANSGVSNNSNQTNTTTGTGGAGLTNEIISALMMADLQKTGGKHVGDLATLAKFAVPDTTKTKIGAKQMDMIIAGQSAQAHLNEMKRLFADGSFNTGRTQIFKQSGRKIFGTGIVPNSDAELKFNNVGNNLLSEYVNMISGAAATDAEREFIRSYMPSITDSPQEVRAKLDEIEKTIKQKMSTLAAATGRYDVTNAAQAATQ